MRIVIGEDSALFREGLARLLTDAGHEIAGKADDAPTLVALVRAEKPDLAIIDIRMPPERTDDGARAARELREDDPTLGIVLLSQHLETRHSVELVTRGYFGYLLKDRVIHVSTLTQALDTITAGGTVLDPDIVRSLMQTHARRSPVAALSDRERDVLALMAEGLSNAAIAERLVVTERAVAKHTSNIFLKLGLEPSDDDNRRVLAVLAYLKA